MIYLITSLGNVIGLQLHLIHGIPDSVARVILRYVTLTVIMNDKSVDVGLDILPIK